MGIKYTGEWERWYLIEELAIERSINYITACVRMQSSGQLGEAKHYNRHTTGRFSSLYHTVDLV